MLWIASMVVLPLSCYQQDRGKTAPPADAPAAEIAMSGAVVMIGAGDIAVCGELADEATARIVDSVLKVDSVAKLQNAVFTLGDNAYPSGSSGASNIFGRCFGSSWGDTTKSIMKFIRPSPGNHDFESRGGLGYYAYFGDRAGPPGQGYYSYDIGQWHVISLNSEITVDEGFFAAARAQEEWLRSDLKDHSKPCTLAYFHQPLFSSGVHGATYEVKAIWDMLYDAGVELVLNGHEHNYERFLPQTPAGVVDSVKGIEEIIVGTGGAGLRGLRHPLAPNSLIQINGYFGVLKLTLGGGEYRHAFLDTEGRVWDRGGRKCH